MTEATPGRSARRFGCLLAAIVVSGVLFAPALWASDYEGIVERAFETMDDSYEESWSFTEVSMREETRYEASFDPRRGDDEPWILVSVDGREPAKTKPKQSGTSTMNTSVKTEDRLHSELRLRTKFLVSSI